MSLGRSPNEGVAVNTNLAHGFALPYERACTGESDAFETD
jgi:hypothetical protein